MKIKPKFSFTWIILGLLIRLGLSQIGYNHDVTAYYHVGEIVQDGQVIYGTLIDANIPFIEHGVHFSANVIKGHKTGYFLDHRENRRQVGLLSKNKTVLDVFSYAGGFSVHALANQAKEVTSIDISKQALTLAIENGRLNRYSGNHKTLAGDAFKILKNLISMKKN